jgi:hypothetical protein
VLAAFVQGIQRSERALDVLDATIRSSKTLAQVRATSSSISQKWRIASGLGVSDFVAALRGARAAD